LTTCLLSTSATVAFHCDNRRTRIEWFTWVAGVTLSCARMGAVWPRGFAVLCADEFIVFAFAKVADFVAKVATVEFLAADVAAADVLLETWNGMTRVFTTVAPFLHQNGTGRTDVVSVTVVEDLVIAAVSPGALFVAFWNRRAAVDGWIDDGRFAVTA
jgi:hypothetical protein